MKHKEVKLGDEFGRLKVSSEPFKLYEGVPKYRVGKYHVTVDCSCGKSKPVLVYDLLEGSVSSCGCYRSDLKLKGSFAKNGEKKCCRCLVFKPTQMFSNNKVTKDGFATCCKDCDRNASLQQNYGISSSEYNELLSSQNNVCAICGKQQTSRKLAVDHCHETGRIRGLLCNHCNTLIGKLGDTKEAVEKKVAKIFKYLEKQDAK